MKITASAPGKLMLFGEHAVVYGYPCIVVAVNRRVHITIHPTPGVWQVDTSGMPDDRFVRGAVSVFAQHFHLDVGSISIATTDNFGGVSGLGTSAATTVATVAALARVYGKYVSKHTLFQLAFQAVLQVQGAGSGFDVAASTFGGVLYYQKSSKPMQQLDSETLHSLLLVTAFTGVKADSVSLIRRVAQRRKKHPGQTRRILAVIGGIVQQAQEALLSKNWKELGMLMNQNQELLTELGVNSPELDQLVTAAKKAGAYGAKLSGAGGGDCMIALVSDDTQTVVERALIDAGGTVVPIEIERESVRVENTKSQNLYRFPPARE